MSQLERPTEEFRVRSYLSYDDEDGRHECEPLACDWVQAGNPAEAIVAACQDGVSIDADRLVVDAQRTDIIPRRKTGGGTPWQIVVLNVAGVGDREEAIREHLARTVPRFVMELEETGLLWISAAMPGSLAWEAFGDLEETLGALGDAVREGIGSGSERLFGSEEPSPDDLWAELHEERTGRPGATGADMWRLDETIDERESDGPPDRELLCRVLRMVEHEGTPAAAALASACRRSVATVERAADDLERWGLTEQGRLTHAGAQFLARDGRVSMETLDFLANSTVDDLYTREAVRRASKRLLQELGEACATGCLVDLVRDLVPSAFEKAVSPLLAARLYAAASALMVRIARGEPAGCVAEELVAVRLVEHARAALAEAEEALGPESVAHATDALTGVSVLFQIDETSRAFEDVEPWWGRRDPRVAAWFTAFGGIVAAGHLEEPRRVRWP